MNQSKADRFSRGGGVRELPLEQEPAIPVAALESVPWRKVIAVAVWLVGLYCTQQTAALLFPGLLAWAAALLMQAAFTGLESPIWRREAYYDDGTPYKRPMGCLAFIILGLDALSNVYGTWAIVARAHTLPFVTAIGEMFGTTVKPLTGAPALLLCLLLAAIICAAPERLWFAED